MIFGSVCSGIEAASVAWKPLGWRCAFAGTPIVPVAFMSNASGANLSFGHDMTPTLRIGGDGGNAMAIAIPILEIGKGTTSRGVGPNGAGLGSDGDPMFTLQAGAQHGVGTTSAVRRLTPLECERLQGFPDGYTDVPYRGKPAADGPRYKALGNSFAVPVVAWIGRRIAAVDAFRQPSSEHRPSAKAA